jgi:hypothetical protein
MRLSTITTRPFAKAIAVAVATAAFAVPTAQAKLTSNDTYGSLDPWAYNLIHPSAPSMTLITEHSAGQNGTAQPVVLGSGGLDSWAKNVVRGRSASIPLITEHSAGQNQQNAVGSSAAAAAPQAGRPSGFDWTDAGIGAGGTLGLVLLAGTGMLALRKRHALAHVRV